MTRRTIAHGSRVRTHDGETVGTVERVVVDPVTKDVTHVVVTKGAVFREDRVVPMSAVAEATERVIALRRGVGEQDFPEFEDVLYLPFEPAGSIAEAVYRLATPLVHYTPYGGPVPAETMALERSVRRNVPDGAVPLESGASVVGEDGAMLGTLKKILTASSGVPTHIVVDRIGLTGGCKAVPLGWIDEISEDRIQVGAPARMVDAIAEYDPK